MTTTEDATAPRPLPAEQHWYAVGPEDVASKLSVDVASGLSAAEAAERLRKKETEWNDQLHEMIDGNAAVQHGPRKMMEVPA